MRDALFALIWAVMFPISLWSAHVGVLLWVWVALISPGEQMYSVMSGIPYNKIVALATLAVVVLNRERKAFYVDATIVLLGVFALIGTLSAATSIAGDPNNWDIYQKLLKELVLAVLICGVMHTRHRMHMLIIVVCLGYGFLAVSEGGQFLLTAGGHKVLGASSVGDNNSLAVAVLMIIPMAYYLAQYSAMRLARVVCLATIALAVMAVMGTASRGGAIGLVVIALMFLRNSRRKLRTGLLVAALGVLVVSVAPSSWYNRLNTLNTANQDESFMERVTVWKLSTLVAIDHPLLGGGFHAIQTWPVWTMYTPRLPFLEFIDTPAPDPAPRAAHSTYFEVLGDLGFLGLGIFLLILAVAIINCSRIRRLTRRRPELAWAGDMAQMIQITLVVYCTTTVALSMGYFEGLYIFLALTSRLLKTVRQTIAGTLPQTAQPAAALPSWSAAPALPLPAISRSAT